MLGVAPSSTLPCGFTVVDVAVALYAAQPCAPSAQSVARGARLLGGADQVRRLSRTLLRINRLMLADDVTSEERDALLSMYWPDLARLQRCTDAAYALTAAAGNDLAGSCVSPTNP